MKLRSGKGVSFDPRHPFLQSTSLVELRAVTASSATGLVRMDHSIKRQCLKTDSVTPGYVSIRILRRMVLSFAMQTKELM